MVVGLVSLLLVLDYFGSLFSPDGGGGFAVASTALIVLTVPLIAFFAVSVLSLRRQITSLKKKHRFVLQQFEQDALTGVRNRETFLAEAQKALRARAPRNYAALLLVDIDHFKQVNDTQGHPAGDEVLMFCAKQLPPAFQRCACRTAGRRRVRRAG